MLSSVFMMQPIGQALAQLVGLWVVLGRENMFGMREMQCGLNTKYDEECKKIVDGIWRIVIGSGAVPAVLAIIFRFFLFDCGLYSLEVKNKAGIALRNTQKVYGAPGPAESLNSFPMEGNGALHGSRQRDSTSSQPMPIQFTKADMYRFFIQEGNWYYLLGMRDPIVPPPRPQFVRAALIAFRRNLCYLVLLGCLLLRPFTR